MSGIEKSIFYFERTGPVNTEKAIEIAKKRAIELQLRHMVVASLSGESALKAAEAMKDTGVKVVCVTYRAGEAYNIKSLEKSYIWSEIPELTKVLQKWKEEGLTIIPGPSNEVREGLRELDVAIVTTTDIGYNINASLMKCLGMKTYIEIFKEALRLLCPGVHVCIFTTMTAVDSGVIPVDKEVVSLSGIEHGLDTALVIKPSYSDEIFDKEKGLEIREIICKPRTMLGRSGFYLER